MGDNVEPHCHFIEKIFLEDRETYRRIFRAQEIMNAARGDIQVASPTNQVVRMILVSEQRRAADWF